MTTPSKSCGFRYSLRTMLIALVIIGVFVGVMGRLFVRKPDIFFLIMVLFSTIVPFVLAIGTIVVLGRKAENKRALVAWTTLLAVMPVVGLVAVQALQLLRVRTMVAAANVSDLRNLSTQQLLTNNLSARIDEPWVWQELEKRVAAGRLSAAKADAAMTMLIDHMRTTKPDGWDKPLSWQREFLSAVQNANLVSDELLLDFHDAFLGKPQLKVARIRETAERLNFSLHYGSVWASRSELAMVLLWDIKSITLDGEPLDYEQRHRNFPDWSGTHQGQLPIGEHELKVELDCVYVAKDKMIGLNAYNLPKSSWPKPAKSWQATATMPFRIYKEDDEIISLTTDPKLRPTGLITSKRFVTQVSGDKKKIILQLNIEGGLAVPVSFDVTAVCGDLEIRLGHIYEVQEGNSTTGGNQTETQIESLDPEIRFADIVLTPNPVHIEGQTNVSQIWGKEIIILNVPLERLDVERVQGADE